MLSVALALSFGGLQQDSDLAGRLQSYEISRAQRRFRDYTGASAPISVVGSQVRTLRAQRGSTITVYCGTLQTRAEGRVTQSRFYWVVDVNAANGLLSDYERGTWSIINEQASDAEETKLCTGQSEGLDDIALLRSTSAGSTGSTLRPFHNDTGRADRQWIVGGWVVPPSCATDTGLTLDADGTFVHGLDSGRWDVDGEIVTLQVSEREVESRNGPETRYFEPPLIQQLSIARLELDRLRVRFPDGSSEEMIRC